MVMLKQKLLLLLGIHDLKKRIVKLEKEYDDMMLVLNGIMEALKVYISQKEDTNE